jgi:hypothetical protein
MDDATKVCVDAYGKGQEYRKSNDLLKARESLWTCAAATCPGVIQSDCTTWLSQIVESIPSIVLEAKLDDDNVFDVAVTMDGAHVASQLDGKPIEINPGLHTLVFERGGNPPIEKKVIVAAHARSQVVSVAWRSPDGAGAARSGVNGGDQAHAAMTRPVPPLTYVLGGVAVAGLGTFAILGLTGSASQHDLETSCSPNCSDSQVSALKTRFLIADIALGVGALSAAGALAVYVLRPEHEAPSGPVASVGISPVLGGAALKWSESF